MSGILVAKSMSLVVNLSQAAKGDIAVDAVHWGKPWSDSGKQYTVKRLNSFINLYGLPLLA
jgi:phage gp29-like protein